MSRNPRLIESPDAVEIFPVETDYKGLRTRIIDLVAEKKLCRGTLETDYINYVLRKRTQYIIGCEKGDELKGFAAITFIDKETLRVFLLCAAKKGKGIGTVLNDAVEEFALMNGVKKIVLKSVDVSHGFYTKVGYKDNVATGMANSEPEDIEEHQRTRSMSKTFKVGGGRHMPTKTRRQARRQMSRQMRRSRQ